MLLVGYNLSERYVLRYVDKNKFEDGEKWGDSRDWIKILYKKIGLI